MTNNQQNIRASQNDTQNQQSLSQYWQSNRANYYDTQPARIANDAVQQTTTYQPPTTGENIPDSISSSLYIPGFLQTQIGKLMRVEFLVANTTVDRVGVLQKVGASYIILQPVGENDLILCDLFAIKFVNIINKDIRGNNVIVT